jgi:hypothetical protein
MMPPCKNFFEEYELRGKVARYNGLFFISISEAPPANHRSTTIQTKNQTMRSSIPNPKTVNPYTAIAHLPIAIST